MRVLVSRVILWWWLLGNRSRSTLKYRFVCSYTGVPTVNDVSASGLNVTCASSGGPATSVTWRRNCAVLPNNAMYQQTQTVTQTQTATYQNMLMIDSTVTDTDGVYTCSVTNARGYDNGDTGMGGKVLLYSSVQTILSKFLSFLQLLIVQLSQ
jgi:maltoporin